MLTTDAFRSDGKGAGGGKCSVTHPSSQSESRGPWVQIQRVRSVLFSLPASETWKSNLAVALKNKSQGEDGC